MALEGRDNSKDLVGDQTLIHPTKSKHVDCLRGTVSYTVEMQTNTGVYAELIF